MKLKEFYKIKKFLIFHDEVEDVMVSLIDPSILVIKLKAFYITPELNDDRSSRYDFKLPVSEFYIKLNFNKLSDKSVFLKGLMLDRYLNTEISGHPHVEGNDSDDFQSFCTGSALSDLLSEFAIHRDLENFRKAWNFIVYSFVCKNTGDAFQSNNILRYFSKLVTRKDIEDFEVNLIDVLKNSDFYIKNKSAHRECRSSAANPSVRRLPLCLCER